MEEDALAGRDTQLPGPPGPSAQRRSRERRRPRLGHATAGGGSAPSVAAGNGGPITCIPCSVPAVRHRAISGSAGQATGMRRSVAGTPGARVHPDDAGGRAQGDEAHRLGARRPEPVDLHPRLAPLAAVAQAAGRRSTEVADRWRAVGERRVPYRRRFAEDLAATGRLRRDLDLDDVADVNLGHQQP